MILALASHRFHKLCLEFQYCKLSVLLQWHSGSYQADQVCLNMQMEKLARLQYLKKKNPKDCALLYLALNRLQVLAGLFKISKDQKDKLLVGFLSRNFQVL